MTVDLGYLYFRDEVICEYPKQNQIRCKTKELVAICAVESWITHAGRSSRRLRWNPNDCAFKKLHTNSDQLRGQVFHHQPPSWAERFMLCLYDLRWSVLVPLKTFSKQESWETNLKINGCPSCSPMRKLPWIWMWYLRDVGRILYKENYPEMGSFMKFQCIIYPDENYPTNSMVSHGGQAPKPGAWEVLLG